MPGSDTIVWRVNHAAVQPFYEAVIDGWNAGWVAHRPHYCDRGHWQAEVNVPHLDGADAFPRYFMRLETAVREMDEFLRWRLWKQRFHELLPPSEIFAGLGIPLIVPDREKC